MRTLHRVCVILIAIGMVNFVLFVGISLLIGGDALNGKEAGGHYYLDSHGRLTEVSRPVFLYSKVHAISSAIGIPLAMLASLVYYATGGRRYPGRPEQP